jgi:dTMP kinase
MFVVVEGVDGSGKSSLVRTLAEALTARGRDPVVLREPGSTPVGERVRALLLDPALGAIDALTEALLFSAARAETVRRLIRPALQAGRTVVLDRYFFSTLAYQGGGGGADLEALAQISRAATRDLLPDLVLLLDLPTDAAARRRRRRPDRIEGQDSAYHARVRSTYLALAESAEFGPRFHVLDATRPAAEVAAEAKEVLFARLGNPSTGAAP